MSQFLLRNRAETNLFAKLLGGLLRPGDILALVGDLGAGKTTLTQAMAREIGYTGPVTSPTFALIHEYPGKTPIVHIDPYRLERPEDLIDLGLEEYLDRECLLIIEWANRLESVLPVERLTLKLEIDQVTDAFDTNSPRIVTLNPVGERYRLLLAELEQLPELMALRREGTTL